MLYEVITALALNLRFVIFSAAIAPGFRGVGQAERWLSGHLLTDGVFATCAERMLQVDDPRWRRTGPPESSACWPPPAPGPAGRPWGTPVP